MAAGQIGQSPTVPGQQTQITLTTVGRLADAEEFNNIIVRTTADGRFVRLRDVARASSSAPRTTDMSSEVGSRTGHQAKVDV